MTVQNSIDVFGFIRLEGPWMMPSQQVEIVQRPGVDGTGIWRIGRRGRPFTMRAEVDAQNKTSAVLFHQLYRELIGADPVEVVWSDVPLLNTDGVLFAVLDVRLVQIHSLANSVGGLNPPSLAWIVTDWDLIAIDFDQGE